MIPKVIHYCWFGGGPKNKLMSKCINSWKTQLPDYEIKEWNEENFDVNMCPYTKEAWENKKYAFVSDVARLYALYTEGGIYMDTDVEVLKTFNPFLHHNMFIGFEAGKMVSTGTIGSEKGNIWLKEILQDYECHHFIDEKGHFNLETIPTRVTRYMVSKGLLRNYLRQEFPGRCTIYPMEYFSPKNYATGVMRCTENTVCIHHFVASWVDSTFLEKIRHKLKLWLVFILGENKASHFTDWLTLRK